MIGFTYKGRAISVVAASVAGVEDRGDGECMLHTAGGPILVTGAHADVVALIDPPAEPPAE